MALHDYLDTTAALYGIPPGGTDQHPLGTAFFLSKPDSEAPAGRRFFIVTAAHVVRGVSDTALAIGSAGTLVATPQWTVSPLADVAACEVPEGYLAAFGMRDIGWESVEGPESAWEARPAQVGDRVLFVGVLPSLQKIGKGHLVVMRGGTLARRDVTQIPVLYRGNTTEYVTGHLIDCLAYKGMSGAPCLFEYFRILKNPSPGVTLNLGHPSQLLGLVTGHFDSYEPVLGATEFGAQLHSTVHTGVGIVTPAAEIRTLLIEMTDGVS